jgi:hypothetical protein
MLTLANWKAFKSHSCLSYQLALYGQSVSGASGSSSFPKSAAKRRFEGKVPANVLSSVVFPHLGTPSAYVLQGPKVGVDGALVSPAVFQGLPIVVTSDPITGSVAELGMSHFTPSDILLYLFHSFVFTLRSIECDCECERYLCDGWPADIYGADSPVAS